MRGLLVLAVCLVYTSLVFTTATLAAWLTRVVFQTLSPIFKTQNAAQTQQKVEVTEINTKIIESNVSPTKTPSSSLGCHGYSNRPARITPYLGSSVITRSTRLTDGLDLSSPRLQDRWKSSSGGSRSPDPNVFQRYHGDSDLEWDWTAPDNSVSGFLADVAWAEPVRWIPVRTQTRRHVAL